MRGKRGQFFSVYLTFLVLAMVIAAILMFNHQEKKIENSVVSPVIVMSLQDEEQMFGLREREIAKLSYETSVKAGLVLGGEEFLKKTKDEFLNRTINSDSGEFIFNGLAFQGEERPINDEVGRRNFLENLYSFSFENGNLKIERKVIEKYIQLKAPELSKISFGTDLSWKIPENKIIIKAGGILE